MTNLNRPTVTQPAPLAEAELDAAINRHFFPRRHSQDLPHSEFSETMPVPREPLGMLFKPDWYERHTAECGEYTANDSEFGALEGVVKGRRYIAAAWLVIAVIGALVWWLA